MTGSNLHSKLASTVDSVHSFPRTSLISFSLLLVVIGMSVLQTRQVHAGQITGSAGLSNLAAPNQKGVVAADCNPIWAIIATQDPGPSSDSLQDVTVITANDVWAVGSYATANTYRTLAEHWNGSSWSIVPTPNRGDYNNYLVSISAMSSSDVWAVGSYSDSNIATAYALAEHWDGTAWSIVSVPNPAPDSTKLIRTTVISSGDVWAVGDYYNSSGVEQTLAEHWNGSVWSVVATPNRGTVDNVLRGISAASSTDIWAVGQSSDSSLSQTLVEHWDGASWSIVSTPDEGSGSNYLQNVAVVSGADVWAVGFYENSSHVEQTLAEHWNGSSWSVVATPNQGAGWNLLYGISILSSTDIWTTGYYRNSSNVDQTLAEHWNGSAWSVVSTPNYETDGSDFAGIAAVSANDIWAVGEYSPSNTADQTLAAHWDGSTWSIAPTPNHGFDTTFSQLNGITVVSANDIWAVGSQALSGASEQTLAEHWNGSAWSIVPTPNKPQPSNDDVLYSVAAASSTDVWAVGYYYDYNNARTTLAEHWDGTAWSIVATPNQPSIENVLYSVSVASANDVWAVGSYIAGNYNGDNTLIEHWNGSAWSIIPSPHPGSGNSDLYGVAAVTSSDVWAVGEYETAGANQTLAEHWDGSAWSIAPTPNQGADTNTLNAVSVIAPNDIWAAGYYRNAGQDLTLAEHWNGSAWSLVTTPNLGAGNNMLNGVSVASTSDVWVAGYYTENSVQRALTEHWNGSVWSIVTTPNQGSGSNALNSISVAASNDVWAAGRYHTAYTSGHILSERYNQCAPSCSVQFADVPSSGGGSTYYVYAKCLVCRGIVSGYACGGAGEPCNANHDPYYRPGANVTRGQLSKIIANAAGLTAPPPAGQQTFHDVAVADPFYSYIENLASSGAISGYPCGTAPAGACDAQQKPYFLPGANATRGQISKIVDLAAGFSETVPPTQQTFSDVPPSSPFWQYIERLAARHIIDGYNDPGHCGTGGGGGVPRFLYNALTTRGQMAKIGANAFFPNCQTSLAMSKRSTT